MKPERIAGDAAGASERVFRARDWMLFSTLSILNVATGYAWYGHAFVPAEWVANPVAMAILLLLVSAMWGNHLLRWLALPAMRRPVPVPANRRLRVAVATTFVPGAEPLKMLERTLRAMTALQYPHDTWVLDEGDDPAVRDLCARLGARHFTRKGQGEYLTDEGPFKRATKYGNYNAWFHEIAWDAYDVITTFDPDHVPAAGFLSNVVGHFENPKIGYVQVAQVYDNQCASMVARGAAEETYAYYSSVQMAAHGLGYPVVIGCHNTHRVAALRAVGGFPPHDAEDLLLTQKYRTAGWEGVYLPRVLARGLAPVDWPAYLHQQSRWARSVLDIKLRRQHGQLGQLPFAARMTGMLHGLNYLSRSFALLGALVLAGLLLAFGKVPLGLTTAADGLLALWLAATSACELYRQKFYLDPAREAGVHWRAALLQYAKFPYMLFSLIDVLRGRTIPYRITPKERTAANHHRLFRPHWIAIAMLSVAWLAGRLSGADVPIAVQLIPPILAVTTIVLAHYGSGRQASRTQTLAESNAGMIEGDELPGAAARQSSKMEFSR
jgi:cellulose synthase/poly-beta-1,6-N-acetylglucosamine synthase-like glycosyltransferase